jgi:hypothetical protein
VCVCVSSSQNSAPAASASIRHRRHYSTVHRLYYYNFKYWKSLDLSADRFALVLEYSNCFESIIPPKIKSISKSVVKREGENQQLFLNLSLSKWMSHVDWRKKMGIDDKITSVQSKEGDLEIRYYYYAQPEKPIPSSVSNCSAVSSGSCWCVGLNGWVKGRGRDWGGDGTIPHKEGRGKPHGTYLWNFVQSFLEGNDRKERYNLMSSASVYG